MTKEIQLTQGKVALIDDEDYERVMKHKWYTQKIGNLYYAAHFAYIPYKQIIYLHRFIFNAKPDEIIDHINGDGLDNRRCNLRIVTDAQNLKNQGKRVGTSSKYKGVSWNKKYNKWQVLIYINKKLIHLGYYDDEIKAAKKYNEMAKKYFKEYARLNFSTINS